MLPALFHNNYVYIYYICLIIFKYLTSKQSTPMTVQSCLPAIIVGQHQTAKLEAELKDNRQKQSQGPQTRESELDFAYQIGKMYKLNID